MMIEVQIGIDETGRKSIAAGLSKLLADTYTLYLKTHNYHWNVLGPHFGTLHELFEKQYLELADAVDMLAERIRALGFAAPASYAEFIRLTLVKEKAGPLSAEEMIKDLLECHEVVIRTARELLPVAEKQHDQPTVDLASARMQRHEKVAWMLRSHLEGGKGAGALKAAS